MISKCMYSKLLLSSALLTGTMLMAQSVPSGGAGSGGAQTQPTTPSQPTTAAGVNSAANDTAMQQKMTDRSFVRKALEGGMAEVQLGQLAQQKSQSDDVKQFGQKMVQDHTQMGDQLKPIAQQLSVKEPKTLPKKDRELMAKLQALSGSQFDEAYIKAMVKDHKEDLRDFKDEAQTTQDPNLKQAAQQGSTVISQHLQMIEQIAQSHNVTASK
ncbi:MAG TPA: DUF4142 domain-containing protein [Alloacidobacterium sp.]|nr:DUF4142 domain-containing protein [Alloacidobacterium sp.]